LNSFVRHNWISPEKQLGKKEETTTSNATVLSFQPQICLATHTHTHRERDYGFVTKKMIY